MLIKVLASLTTESGIFLSFFFTFRKKWVGQAMGNETFYWNGRNDIKMGSNCDSDREKAQIVKY